MRRQPYCSRTTTTHQLIGGGSDEANQCKCIWLLCWLFSKIKILTDFLLTHVTDVYARGVSVNLTPLTSKWGALATDARGCSLWRSLLERPPPAWESRVRDPLGTRYEFGRCGPGRGCYTHILKHRKCTPVISLTRKVSHPWNSPHVTASVL